MHLVPLVVVALSLSTHPGAPLYVVSKGVKLLKEPKLTSAPASPKELAPDTELTFLGVSEKDPAFVHVEYAGKKGFLLRTFVRPHRAQAEFFDGQRALDARAFAASGAATTRPWPQPRSYLTPEQARAAAQLLSAEELTREKATPEALDAKARELGTTR